MEDFTSIQDLNIVLVDDDESIRHSLTFYFRKKNVALFSFATAEEALQHMQKNHSDLVITDYRLPGMNGLQLLNVLNLLHCEVGKILITGYGNSDVAVDAMELGVHDFIQKPFSARTIAAAVQKLILKEKIGIKTTSHVNTEPANLCRGPTGDKEPLDSNGIIGECIARISEHAERHGIQIRLVERDAPQEIEADRVKLCHIVESVVMNAVLTLSSLPKASRKIVIAVEGTSWGKSIVLTYGLDGMANSHRDGDIQQVFTTNENVNRGGLYAAQTLTKELGGSLDIKNDSACGTRVEIKLPHRWTGVDRVAARELKQALKRRKTS